MLTKRAFIIVGVTIPIIAYVATILSYAYGGYDGQNCAGLLDAVWECNEFEYYLEWLLNPFALVGLIGYGLVSFITTPIVWKMYKNDSNQKQSDA